MSEKMNSYEKFKLQVEAILKGQPVGLSWTEIKQQLGLKQNVPNNKWVRMMEKDIGLLRVTEKGKKLWKLKVTSP